MREWHGAGIKPAVDDLRNAVSGFATFTTGKRDIVNVRAMWVHCERVIACEVRESLPKTMIGKLSRKELQAEERAKASA